MIFRRFILWLLKPLVKDQDIRELMVDMSSYTPMDRYRDFIKTFGTPEGKRTFTQIMQWGNISRAHYTVDMQSNEMFLKEGERNLALKIMAALSAVPRDQPTERRKKG